MTVTLLNDHLGQARPRVMGHEYVVDATVNILDYEVAGYVVTAASLGLNKITQAMICGYESAVVVPKILVDADGTYTSDSSITILVQNPDGSDADAMALGVDGLTDLGMVRIRVWGSLA
jgi:hypothetical protein